jgi:hypothetical protein
MLLQKWNGVSRSQENLGIGSWKRFINQLEFGLGVSTIKNPIAEQIARYSGFQ